MLIKLFLLRKMREREKERGNVRVARYNFLMITSILSNNSIKDFIENRSVRVK